MDSTCIYICDFNDSFTFNIYSELKLINDELRIEVIPFEKIPFTLNSLSQTSKKCAVILGPGPGAPDEYSHLFDLIQVLKRNENIFLMGICLGHQLYWKSMGFPVVRCKKPIHGQTQHYSLNTYLSPYFNGEASIKVQRYNSLQVILNTEEQRILHTDKKALIFEDELVMYQGERFVTYQFHPESIGTPSSYLYFSQLINHVIQE